MTEEDKPWARQQLTDIHNNVKKIAKNIQNISQNTSFTWSTLGLLILIGVFSCRKQVNAILKQTKATEKQTLLMHQWQLSTGNRPDSVSKEMLDYVEELEKKYQDDNPALSR